jgi:uncharacterized membrane protein HdeD (DUF308 family)
LVRIWELVPGWSLLSLLGAVEVLAGLSIVFRSMESGNFLL